MPYFEEDLGGGYCSIELSAFNWNQQRKATHSLDPFALTRAGVPLKRKMAASILDELKKASTRGAQIEQIAHRGLRELLRQQPAEQAPERFVRWLQRSVSAGLRQATASNHPADQARQRLLEAFATCPAETIVAGESPIPSTIGVRCINKGSQNKIDVTRVDGEGKDFQRYQSQPVVRELYVGYKQHGGQLDRSAPVILIVNQIYGVRRQVGSRRVIVDVPADSPLRGRPHGSREKFKDFLVRWRDDFSKYCVSEGIVKTFKIVQGCLIEKTDGSRFQMRNFSKEGEWMRADSFRDIHRVHRSPFHGT